VAWGVVLATVATLLVVPAGYLILNDIQQIGGRRRNTSDGSLAGAAD
jgi:hypothetical protein